MTVSRRSDRGNWQFIFGYNGKTYRKSGFKTKREAVLAETEFRRSLTDGMIIDDNITFHEYFKEWCETYKEPNISQKTYTSYKTIIRILSKHKIGELRLHDITRRQYQKFINEFARNHSNETIRKLNGKISSSIDDAVYEGLIKKNFTYKVTYNGMIKPQDEDAKFISLKEYSKLKEEIKNSNSLSSLVLYIMIATGCRISGAIGLRYEYLDKFKSTVFINENKTDTSPRTVEISRKDMKFIMQRIDEFPKNINGYVFGNGISINAVNKALKKYCDKLEIKKITTHALRHTHCSYLLSKGVSIQYISKRLGHKNIKITLEVYSHLLEESFREENEKAIQALQTL
ncbi:site-specific integrase [Staphylococcus aureus]|uniref:site-specific integrase n=1 Tax=Staphylococcus aureus TaxID=1280 RepID=UPI00215C28BD|nr:site-specific integrase [Staphylococcus aureus]UVJ08989.1 site-specific integrase [Staphylococcus aureus]